MDREHRFHGKTRSYRILSVVLGACSALCLLGGLVFLVGLVTDMHGEAFRGTGVLLIVLGALLLLASLAALLNVRAAGQPIIGLYQQGIEILLVERSGSAAIGMLPNVLQVAFSCLLSRGVHTMRFRIAWEDLVKARLRGPDEGRQISFYGAIAHCGPGYEHVVEEKTSELYLDEGSFEDRLDVILEAIEGCLQNPGTRAKLPPWERIGEETNEESSS